jgi:hypothetical protein
MKKAAKAEKATWKTRYETDAAKGELHRERMS